MSDHDTSQDGDGKLRTLEQLMKEKSGMLSPQDSIQTAGERMRSLDAASWPVSEGRKLVGVINEPNPDLRAAGHGHDPGTLTVGETMSRDMVFCYEDQDAAEALRRMTESNLRHLPVVDREMRVLGMVSREEVEQHVGAADSRIDGAKAGA